MPRLFTGLEIPADVGFALSLKRGGLTGARWIDPENYHITLRFTGDVDGNTTDEVADSLDRLSNSLQFPIRLTHLGSFGGDKPRALYAGVEPSEALTRLFALGVGHQALRPSVLFQQIAYLTEAALDGRICAGQPKSVFQTLDC